MKKFILLISAVIVVLALILFNPSESSFSSFLSHSSDVDVEMAQNFKTAQPVVNFNKHFFSPFCNVKRINILILSVYVVDYGWWGNLRIDGSPIDKSKIVGNGEVYRSSGKMYILSALNNHFKISNSFEKNWK